MCDRLIIFKQIRDRSISIAFPNYFSALLTLVYNDIESHELNIESSKQETIEMVILRNLNN